MEWTCKDIRSVLKNLKEKDKKETGTALSGLTRDELVEMAEQHNLTITKSDTRGDIIVKLREKIRMTTPARGEDLIGFGKCLGMSYTACKERNLDYCKWVLRTKQERKMDTCSELQRFAKWLEEEFEVESQQKDKKETEFEDEPDPTWILPDIDNDYKQHGATNTDIDIDCRKSTASSATPATSSDRMTRLERQVDNLTKLIMETMIKDDKITSPMTDADKRLGE